MNCAIKNDGLNELIYTIQNDRQEVRVGPLCLEDVECSEEGYSEVGRSVRR